MASTCALYRPTIRELSAFLLSPPTQQHPIRCISQLARSSTSLIRNTSQPLSARQISRSISLSAPRFASPKPQTHDRGPASSEDTQTDFAALNVLGNTPAPSTSIDACLWDGFHLNSGVKISGGTGVILVAGEAFEWRPWESPVSGGKPLSLVNAKGQWDVSDEAWGLLGLVWPKPDLLILGLGKDMRPISPRTRQFINSLGIRVDISDTRNAAAQFNLLATERGVSTVAAALIPMGFRDGVGVETGEK
ncbi:uncharacterized protein RAG0_05332 [Rhynchosporium agropyri]|uniref:NADH dehydrogenase [ubiquinone] 1 alpha subcomplex assembly factor 3 n=1 Tax=Rhynchosporium agropyri TaxID=914238 RepID=A0A1E1KGC2_9HELO|nr:uncharacterized protein RAG0_05332 [Rhynchosporium agropyri]